MKNLTDYTIEEIETLLDVALLPMIETSEFVLNELRTKYKDTISDLVETTAYKTRIADLERLKTWEHDLRNALAVKSLSKS